MLKGFFIYNLVVISEIMSVHSMISLYFQMGKEKIQDIFIRILSLLRVHNVKGGLSLKKHKIIKELFSCMLCRGYFSTPVLPVPK